MWCGSLISVGYTVADKGVEPLRLSTLGFESSASAISPVSLDGPLDGTGGPFPLDLTVVTPRTPTRIRTENPLIKSQVQ